METKKNTDGENFSFKDIKNFDVHIDASIKGLAVLYDILIELTPHFIKEDSNVYDLGCSKGSFLNRMWQYNLPKFNNVSYVGYDIEENLLPQISSPHLNYFKRDVTDRTLVLFNTNLCMSIFTLQFLRYRKRIFLIEKVYSSLEMNGAFIVAEKILGESGNEEFLLAGTTRQLKREFFDDSDILGKDSKLRRIMEPLSSSDNEKLFRNAGFREVIPIWQVLNFKCWLLIK